MGEMQRMMMGIMVFSIAILGMSNFYVAGNNAYGTPADDLSSTEKFEQVFNKTSNIQTQIQDTQNAGILEQVFIFAESAINAALLLFDIPGIMVSILADASILIPGMPSWFVTIVSGMIGITVLFAIFFIITKVRP